MDELKIQKLADEFPAKMSAKGLIKPVFHITFSGNEEISGYARWDDKTKSFGDGYEFFKGKNVAAILKAADKWVAKLPSAEETKMRQFMAAVGGAIDIGKSLGIEVEFLNPLAETMKRLSENALTFQPSTPSEPACDFEAA